MPSVSKAQKRLFQAVANNKKFARKVGIPQDVAKEYMKEDMKGYSVKGKKK